MVEQVVGLRFVVQGEEGATARIKAFSKAQKDLSNNIKTGAGIAARLEKDILSLSKAAEKGTITDKAYVAGIRNIIREYKALNQGIENNKMSIQKATSDVYKMVNAIKSEEQAREKLLDTRRRAETAFALAMQRHNEEQRALQQEQAERLRLEAMYDRNAVAARVYQNAVANLNRAEQLGVITADQKAKELLQLEAAYQRAGTSANRTNTFINQFGEGARIAGVKTNRFGLYAQQVGYQVGDFFVQIQSGTNAFVAFGQQATQLAGLLPGLAGAIVGIGISVATMFLSAWSRANAALDDTAESVKNLQGELDSLDTSLQEWLKTKKAAELGITKEELIGRTGVEEAQEELQSARDELNRLVESYGKDIGPVEIEALTGITGYSDALQKVEEAERRLALVRQRETEERGTERQTQIEENYINMLKKRVESSIEAADAHGSILATLQEELILSQTILKYGKDSEQVAILKASNERAAFMEQAKQQGILGNNLAIVMALYDQNVKVSNEVEAASEKAKEFAEALKEASSAMASLSGFSANLDRELAVATAKVEALRQGADATIAGNIAGMRADLERRMGEAVAAGVDRGIVERQFGGERARISQLEALRQEEKRLGERGRGGAGGAGGAAQGDYLSQLQKEAELKLRLIGLTDEQRRYEEIAAELRERGLSVEDEEKRIQAIIATEQALQQATNAEERRQEIMQAVTGNIETALMGLVEGTSSVEDAFKSMMRNIILEVYRQQVAKPFADAIGSFFFANGAAFQGGNVVPFANGGVVGGPTTFPMSNGRTGLMGEAGPEAIMPLKRGKDGKLGVVAEGGGTTVNNYFTVQANGDDSVKRIVQQQIPRIAEATKAAVVDAKRRGGAYGKAFA